VQIAYFLISCSISSLFVISHEYCDVAKFSETVNIYYIKILSLFLYFGGRITADPWNVTPLVKLIVSRLLNKFPVFEGTPSEISLPFSQESDTGPYSGSDESNPHADILFL